MLIVYFDTNLEMKIIEIKYDKQHFVTNFILFGKTLYKKVNYKDLYIQYRKYQDCAKMGYKLLCFSDIRSVKKASGFLREMQLEQLRLIKDLVNLADANNLSYWCNFGTLLGAVRHKGYIPWDYDSDLSMFRDDYFKFIELVKNYYKDNKSYLITEISRGNVFYLRVRYKNERIGVDVFPYEKVKCKCSKSELSDLVSKYRCEFESKIKKGEVTKDNYQNVIRSLMGKLSKEACDLNSSIEKEYIFESICHPYIHKAIMLKDEFLPLVYLDFEDTKLASPKCYQEYLTLTYGNIHEYPNLMIDYESTNFIEKDQLTYPEGIHPYYSTDIDVRINPGFNKIDDSIRPGNVWISDKK